MRTFQVDHKGMRAILRFLVVAVVLWTAPAGAVEVQRVTGGGVEAWLVEDKLTPIVTVHIAFRGGAATDPQGKAGRAAMAAALLTEGAGDLDSAAFQTRLEELAIRVNADADMDLFSVSLRTLTRHQDAAFALLRSMLTAPRFDADAMERVRQQFLASLRQRAEDPSSQADEALLAALFPDHPYGRPIDGTTDSIAAITADDLRAFVRERIARDGMIVGVVGDIAPAALAEVLATTFGALPEAAAPIDVADVTPVATDSLTLIEQAVPQSVVVFAQPGLKRLDPDWYAALVANHILGGGSFTSRLYQEVRERRGLAYGVSSRLMPMHHSALLRGGAGTANERVGETVQVIRDQWAGLAEAGVSEAEVADAKTFLTGSFALRFISSPQIAQMLVGMQLYDLGPDYFDRYAQLIDGITTDDVNRVVRRLIRPDALSIVVAGKPVGLLPSN